MSDGFLENIQLIMKKENKNYLLEGKRDVESKKIYDHEEVMYLSNYFYCWASKNHNYSMALDFFINSIFDFKSK